MNELKRLYAERMRLAKYVGKLRRRRTQVKKTAEERRSVTSG